MPDCPEDVIEVRRNADGSLDEIVAGDARRTAGAFVRLLGVKAAEWEARFGEPVAWDSVLAVLGHLIAGFSVPFNQDEDLDAVLTQIGDIAKGLLPEVREIRRRLEAEIEEAR